MTPILLDHALASTKLVVLAGLLLARGLLAAQQTTRSPALTHSPRSVLVPADLLALQQASDVQLSPDGRQLYQISLFFAQFASS